eukprot:1755021-Alexandrium_andersonii.AAC.1
MSASLVGSEMCIRDSASTHQACAALPACLSSGLAVLAGAADSGPRAPTPSVLAPHWAPASQCRRGPVARLHCGPPRPMEDLRSARPPGHGIPGVGWP